MTCRLCGGHPVWGSPAGLRLQLCQLCLRLAVPFSPPPASVGGLSRVTQRNTQRAALTAWGHECRSAAAERAGTCRVEGLWR